MKGIVVHRLSTPAGDLLLGDFEQRLCLADWPRPASRSLFDRRLERRLGARMVEGKSELIAEAERQLGEYFSGRRREFDLPVCLAGTPFQQAVWSRLSDIRYGSTVSYGDLARELGCPKSVRAVANAVGANPVSIIIPCHRVVGSDGSLTGYAGGLDAKRILLGVETAHLFD